MNEDQRPLGGQDEQDSEQTSAQAPAQVPERADEQTTVERSAPADLTEPVDLDSTLPLASYPPPTGDPFARRPPPPTGDPFAQRPPPPTGDPFAQRPPPPTGDPFAHPPPLPPGGPSASYPPPPGGPFAHLPPPPAETPVVAGSPVTAHPSERTGLRGLGAGAIAAIVAGALVIAVVAALLGGVTGAFVMGRTDVGSATLPAAPSGSVPRPPGSIADIASRSLPSVVTIKVQSPAAEGTGSGFVLRKDGYILTNNHVVAVAAQTGKITVLFSDGKTANATIVGRDESYDLAVIRVDRKDLPVLTLGASSTVVVGDQVIAVGAPLGLNSTVTSGIVSALNRPVTAGGGAGNSSATFINAIQTDAAINPGNSGGPLLDMTGRVIGVNSAIARAGSDSPLGGGSTGNIGVGFAIPSDQARKTAEQLIASGKATHPVIGVLLDPAYNGEGVKISAAPENGDPPITKGGPADKAGLKPGDVILKFEGRVVNDRAEFVVAVRAKSVGDQVELTVRRGSTVQTVKMTLQAAN
jgi:putative serine protease PepD